jgi:tight adherence protein C
MLLRAGEPGLLTAADFFGLRVMSGLILGGGALLLVMGRAGLLRALLFAIVAALIGYLLPQFWLGSRVRARQQRIRRALPNALDMLTVGVEAGLAFESAMLRVGEKIQGPLSREFRRVVGEMRVGTGRDVALQRMCERIGLDDLDTFVAVLIQSTQLGVPIARVLHEQAAEIRLKRRQRVEELARQAGVKMVFPLTFFILPALFIVAIGPAIPRIAAALSGLAIGGGAGLP